MANEQYKTALQALDEYQLPLETVSASEKALREESPKKATEEVNVEMKGDEVVGQSPSTKQVGVEEDWEELDMESLEEELTELWSLLISLP